jgi:putative NADPH-quinone reductase
MDFDPRVKPEESAQFAGGALAADAPDQGQKVAAADAPAFIHPLWGRTMPAVAGEQREKYPETAWRSGSEF